MLRARFTIDSNNFQAFNKLMPHTKTTHGYGTTTQQGQAQGTDPGGKDDRAGRALALYEYAR